MYAFISLNQILYFIRGEGNFSFYIMSKEVGYI